MLFLMKKTPSPHNFSVNFYKLQVINMVEVSPPAYPLIPILHKEFNPHQPDFGFGKVLAAEHGERLLNGAGGLPTRAKEILRLLS
jgi:hypothetical protein